MGIRNIRTEEDPILRKISKPVKAITPRIGLLIDDLFDTMNEADGVGLAAVQVGVLRRVAVVSVEFESPEESSGEDFNVICSAEDIVPPQPMPASSLKIGLRSDAAVDCVGNLDAADDCVDDDEVTAADESAGDISTDIDDKPNVAPPLAEGDNPNGGETDDYMTEGTIVMVNPVWEAEGSEMQRGSEGCLSVPGKCGEVERPLKIKLKAFDRNLEPYELMAEGLFARAIMHECDHLDGILYTDKVIGDLYDVMQDDGEAEES